LPEKARHFSVLLKDVDSAAADEVVGGERRAMNQRLQTQQLVS
jgi:hypothetical protein